jgi:hypothetical protein
MVDVWRYGWAMLIVLGTVHLASLILWYPIGIIFSLMTLPWKASKPTKYMLAIFNIFKYYCLIGIGVQLQQSWTDNYPQLKLWFSVLSFIVFLCYPIKGYVMKKWQEDALYQVWRTERNSFEPSYQIFDDYENIRGMTQGFKFSAVVGTLMAMVYLINTSLFVTHSTLVAKSLASSVWKVSVVPIVLAVVGLDILFNWRRTGMSTPGVDKGNRE